MAAQACLSNANNTPSMTVTYHTASVDDCGKPLQELSRDDTQDLTAFQDKRRWFEGKLKVMRALSESRLRGDADMSRSS